MDYSKRYYIQKGTDSYCRTVIWMKALRRYARQANDYSMICVFPNK